MKQTLDVDAVIIGGGPAGLAAALNTGRARRRVAVLDQGSPRHAVSPAVHGFLTQEGTTPAALRRIAWEQLAQFPTVTHHNVRVEGLRREGERWVADCGEAGLIRGRAALLAAGVQDLLPDWPGLTEKWAHSVHLCPFCHGWESRDQPLATYGHGEHIAHFGPLLAGWSDDIIVIADTPLPAEVEAMLRAKGISVIAGEIAALEGPGATLEAIRLADGRRIPRRGLFLAPRQRQLPLVRSLGLETTPTPANTDGLVAVDMFQRTSAPMLWAAGDLCSRMQQVIESAAAGARAGATIQMALTEAI